MAELISRDELLKEVGERYEFTHNTLIYTSVRRLIQQAPTKFDMDSVLFWLEMSCIAIGIGEKDTKILLDIVREGGV